jgi:flavin-binding protein dodecin
MVDAHDVWKFDRDDDLAKATAIASGVLSQARLEARLGAVRGLSPPGRLPSCLASAVVVVTVVRRHGGAMPNSIYKVIELVGSNPESWEKAAAGAVEQASKTLRDLRVAEVVAFDMHLEDGKVAAYRVRLKVSFKFEGK